MGSDVPGRGAVHIGEGYGWPRRTGQRVAGSTVQCVSCGHGDGASMNRGVDSLDLERCVRDRTSAGNREGHIGGGRVAKPKLRARVDGCADLYSGAHRHRARTIQGRRHLVDVGATA